MKLALILPTLCLTFLTSHAVESKPSATPLTKPSTVQKHARANLSNFSKIPVGQPFWISYSYSIPTLFSDQYHMIRRALEQIPNAKISENSSAFGVEILIDSNSTVTTAQIIKILQKTQCSTTPDTILQKIIPSPKFKYLITLKEKPNSDTGSTILQNRARQQIKKKLTSDYVFIADDTIEIWSNEEIDLSKLENEKLLTLEKSDSYGGGMKSVKKLEN